jgi:hypothetical protein
MQAASKAATLIWNLPSLPTIGENETAMRTKRRFPSFLGSPLYRWHVDLGQPGNTLLKTQIPFEGLGHNVAFEPSQGLLLLRDPKRPISAAEASPSTNLFILWHRVVTRAMSTYCNQADCTQNLLVSAMAIYRQPNLALASSACRLAQTASKLLQVFPAFKTAIMTFFSRRIRVARARTEDANVVEFRVFDLVTAKIVPVPVAAGSIEE